MLNSTQEIARLGIRVPKDLHDRAYRAAKQSRVTIAQFLAEAVEEKLHPASAVVHIGPGVRVVQDAELPAGAIKLAS